MTLATTETLRPAAEEAQRRGISRERLVRQISKGEVLGVVIAGRYFAVVGEAKSDSGTQSAK